MGRTPNRRVRCAWRVGTVVLFSVLVSVLCGCTTGQPASTSSWQSSSDRALGEAISGLGTARVVVQQETRDHLPHSYSVEAVTDVIETGDKETASYLVAQPPDDLHQANLVVTAALQEAATLLVEVRVELASPGLTTTSAHELVDRIDAMRDKLDKLDTAVKESPGSVAPR